MAAPEKPLSISDPLRGTLGYELRRTSAATMAALGTALMPFGLSPGEASMLMVIGSNPGCTQSDVGRALRVQPANMVPLVNKLRLSGLVDRLPTEGRAMALFLTERGREHFDAVRDVFAQHEARIGKNLPESVRIELVEALRSICHEACHAIDI